MALPFNSGCACHTMHLPHHPLATSCAVQGRSPSTTDVEPLTRSPARAVQHGQSSTGIPGQASGKRVRAGVSTPAIEESPILENRSPPRGPDLTDSGHVNCVRPERGSDPQLRGRVIGRNCRISVQETIEEGIQEECNESKVARDGRPAIAPAAVAAAAPRTEPRISFSNGSQPARCASM